MKMRIEEYLSFALVVGLAAATPIHRGTGRCGGDFLAKYNLTIETFWSREIFTKQYPLFRPHAQWSKLVGRSHDEVHSMWRVGELATRAVQLYAEKGDSSLLDQQVQGTLGVLDAFTAGPISDSGVGKVSSKFLVDENHSKLSTMMRIVPSPDWFVGLDSLEMCEHGRWLQHRTLDVAPYDAGTDRGFTFTAPNWPETPHKPVSEITSKIPNHPANSFFYPDLEKLPVIARVHIMRVDLASTSDFHQSEVSNQETESQEQEVVVEESEAERPPVVDALPAQQPHHRQPLIALGGQTPLFRTRTRVGVVSEPVRVAPTTTQAVRTTTTTTTTELPTTRRSLFRDMQRKKQRKERRKNRRGNRKSKNQRRKPAASGPRIDCEVGDWSDWGPCSKTCGFGNKMRIRTATVEPQNGGMPCPPLREEQICGSMRSCGWSHFSGFSWGAENGKDQ